MTDEQERAAFFTWVADCGCDTDGAWSAWQARAALASQAQPVAQKHIYAGDCPDDNQPEARDPSCPACLASQVVQEPVAWVSRLEWKPRQSEQVAKLTRKAQPEYGFTLPLYAAPLAAGEPHTDGVKGPSHG